MASTHAITRVESTVGRYRVKADTRPVGRLASAASQVSIGGLSRFPIESIGQSQLWFWMASRTRAPTRYSLSIRFVGAVSRTVKSATAIAARIAQARRLPGRWVSATSVTIALES